MLSDIEISKNHQMEDIRKIADKANIKEDYLECYGKYKAKIDNKLLNDLNDKEDGKLILVSAISPTSAGEGKTTVTIGLADGLNLLNKKTIVALREPSLGPVFGVKGGATGGGYAQVCPMEDINLHFTGDFHAIGAANNLLCALLDNHIYQGNMLNIDPKTITIKRVVDMNDRQLRNVVDGLGGKTDGNVRQDGFEITVASEVMAVFCLANSLSDLKEKLGDIIVAYTYDGDKVTARDLKANGAMSVLLKDAFKPNLVQTLAGNPALIHGGPFANIAHGCNSLQATKLALKLGDYVVTEAGFGADLGAEKFLDIKCRKGNLKPSVVVLVASIRALKLHGGSNKDNLKQEDLVTLEKGLDNLYRHVSNIENVYKLPCVVALNIFESDSDKEISLTIEKCNEKNIKIEKCEVYTKGGNGATKLANRVLDSIKKDNDFTLAYEDDLSIKNKIEAIVTKIYHGSGVNYENKALKTIKKIEELGYSKLPICMAKTQYSFCDDAKKLNAPEDFKITVKNVKLAAGAGFIVVYTGDIMTMPGLPKKPASENIDIDENGEIVGLF